MIRLLFALSLLWAGHARADSLKDSVSNISVVGEASAEIAPDRAKLRLGVVTERPTAAAAARENAGTVEAIFKALEAMGIPAADVQTQGVALLPFDIEERDAKGKPKGTQKLYRATNTVTVVVKPVERVGDVAGKAIEMGANSLEGIEYDLSNTAEKRDALRADAVKDAERRAKVYADAAGLQLARVLEIRPLDESGPAPQFMEARAAPPGPDAVSVPLRPGLQRLTERVSITWALSR